MGCAVSKVGVEQVEDFAAVQPGASKPSAPAPLIEVDQPEPEPQRGRSIVPAGKRSIIPAGKHAMLSYNWGHQEIVERANEALTALGVPCWMDIKGGMKTDIYDSMAEAVQGAGVVICFMSRKYQTSDNCKLELKFAAQTGVPIVPVMMEDRWKASDWLGGK